MTTATADLSDAHPEKVQVVEAGMFRSFGERKRFAGPCTTVSCFEDNVLVRATLETDGAGRVLVVDGRGSRRCALLGDRLAALARDHDWAGVIVHGCIRDSAEIDGMDVAVRALATHPRKSEKRGEGSRDVDVTFGGVTFRPGAWVYADADGILVSAVALE